MALRDFHSSQRVTVQRYSHYWRRLSVPGAGCALECQKDGTLLVPISGWVAEFNADPDLAYEGIRDESYRATVPAYGTCVCGETINLDRFTNACSCGRDYNMSGQLLAPRRFWGEETGESLADILTIP